MIYWLFAAVVVFWLVLSAGWLWLCAGFRRDGLRGGFGRAAIQLSGVALLLGVLNGSHVLAIAGFAFPPSALVLLRRFTTAPEFALALAIPALAAFAVALVVGGLLLRPRIWALGPALLAALSAGLVAGELASRRAMCAGLPPGVTEVQRNSFPWSLRETPRDFMLGIHAEFEKDGQRFFWSYRQMGWHPLPRSVTANIDTPGRTLVCD